MITEMTLENAVSVVSAASDLLSMVNYIRRGDGTPHDRNERHVIYNANRAFRSLCRIADELGFEFDSGEGA